MIRNKMYLWTLALLATMTFSLQAQWFINTPINLLTTTLPQDSVWVVQNGGILTIDPSQVLTVRGTLDVEPGGIVVIDNDAMIIMFQPQGRMRLQTFSGALLARMYIRNNSVFYITPNTALTMGQKAQVNFSSAGLIKILDSGYINMSDAYINNNAAGSGFIHSYETRPFRGTGNFKLINMLIQRNFTVAASDLFYFIDGGKIDFTPVTAAGLFWNVDGIIKFPCTSATQTFTLANKLDGIILSATGSMNSDITTLDSVPKVSGAVGSGIETGSAYWHMRKDAGISTNGSLYCAGTTFDATNGRRWGGISVVGSSARLGMKNCLITTLNQNATGLRLHNATYTSNRIDRTTIQCPFGPFGNTGYGVLMSSSASGTITYLKITCSDINGFNIGIKNTFGDLVMDGVDVYVNNKGLDLRSCTADISRSFVRNNYSDGIYIESIAARPPSFRMKHSSVTGNQGYQFNLYNTVWVYADSSNIYYRTGNTTMPIVYANISGADMPYCYWGIYPSVPAQFVLVGGSAVTHSSERMAPWLIDRGCIYPKIGDFNLSDVPEPRSSIVARNYPNPFNPSTTIEYTLPEAANVVVKVYTLNGEEVALLVNENQTEGTHRVVFNAAANIASGVYIYEVRTPGAVTRGNMMLSK